MSEREASPSSEKERYLSHLEQNWDWDEAVKKLEGGKELTESGALFLGNVNDFVPPGGNHKMADFFEALSDIGSRHGVHVAYESTTGDLFIRSPQAKGLEQKQEE
jgi:hypothetical protein